jgi:uncharacterized protein
MTTTPIVGTAHVPLYGKVHTRNQLVQGYLGTWVRKNITHELLEFPIDEYLWPYYSAQIILKHWPPEEFLGKYTEAMAYAYQYADGYDRESWPSRLLRNRMEQIVEALIRHKDSMDPLFSRYFRTHSDEDELWDLWGAKYVILGLVAYHELFADPLSLQAAVATADKVISLYGGSSERPINRNSRACLDAFARLYTLTGEKRFLEFCELVMEKRVRAEFIDEMIEGSGKVCNIPDCHSYTVLAVYIGILHLYLCQGGSESYLKACKLAVDDIVKNRLHVSGGMSSVEHFREDGVLGGTPCELIDEACAVAHFIRLCLELFWVTGEPRYIDYLEGSLYNNGLGSKNPRDPYLVSYFTPLQGYRVWKRTNVKNGTPCCTTSMAREIARVPDMLWAKKRDAGLAVLLYNEARMEERLALPDHGEVDVTLEMVTKFPAEGRVILTVRSSRPAEFDIELRVPAWCHTFCASVNGTEKNAGTPGAFLVLRRPWGARDTIEIEMDVPVVLVDGAESYPGFEAIQRGPQVMVVDARTNPGVGNLDALRLDLREKPQLTEASAERLPRGWQGSQIYATSMLRNVLLVPFAEAGQMAPGDRYRTWIRVEDGWTTVDDPELTYVGQGWREDRCRVDDFLFVHPHGNRPLDWLDDFCPDSYFGGSVHRTDSKGDYMTYTFNGTGVELYGCAHKHTYRGYFFPCAMDIFIDDQPQGEVGFSENQFQRLLFTRRDLPPGIHTIRAVCVDKTAFIDYLRFAGPGAKERRA